MKSEPKGENKSRHSHTMNNRITGIITGDLPGPTLLCICGIHGNESSGVVAFAKVMERLRTDKHPINGQLVGLAGNLAALKKGTRFIDRDLNRIWTEERITRLKKGSQPMEFSEEAELMDLLRVMQKIFDESRGPIYVLDLHTTSSHSGPFITINDTIRNREFAREFPMPVVLGIEEHLEGTALSYINELGFIAVGIESGQHQDPASVIRHEAYIWLALQKNGSLRSGLPQIIEKELGTSVKQKEPVYEVRYREALTSTEDFKLYYPFKNFEPVKKGELIAGINHSYLMAPEDGRIFMPLYQRQGEDAFFIVREIKPFWLWLSKWLRKTDLHKLIPFFPGVSTYQGMENELLVNTRIARWYVLEFFHLMGFRRKKLMGKQLLFSRRKYDFDEPPSFKSVNAPS